MIDRAFDRGWKDKVEKCFGANWPEFCPQNSPCLESKKLSEKNALTKHGKTINYCKYKDYCRRKFQKKKFKDVFK